MTDKLILGTVQFGIPYGINNSTGLLPENEVIEILHQAKISGINTLDTAAAYGVSESRIGKYHQVYDAGFNIVTKFSKDKEVSWKDSIENSLKKLNVPKVETLMFHSFDAYKENQSLIEEIISIGKNRYFNNIGVSVYTNQELLSLIDDHNIEVIQLPFNLLDNHSLRSEILIQLKNKGKTIHTRSCFLQGLFFKNINQLPPNLLPLIHSLKTIQALAEEYKISLGQLALSYVLKKDYIDGVLIGVDTLAQLKQNIQSAKADIPNELSQRIDDIKIENIHLLNPSLW